jgi:protein subunit release factor B
MVDLEDLTTNSAVLVTFTVSKYSTQAQRSKGLPAACSLNIKEMVILAYADTDGDLAKDFDLSESSGVDLRKVRSIDSFEYKAPGPKQSDKERMRKETEAKKEKIHAEKAKKKSA